MPAYDIAIVGAGFSGSIIALKLSEAGFSIKVFDSTERYPENFRAEKLETEQYELLEKLELIQLIKPATDHLIKEVVVIQGNNTEVKPQKKQRGMDYCATVNNLRNALEQLNLLQISKVDAISVDEHHQYFLQLLNGEAVSAKLVIYAGGKGSGILESLQVKPSEIYPLYSTTLGFDVEPLEGASFPLEAFNFRPSNYTQGLDYATFFPIGKRIRANVFTYWPIKSKDIELFKTDPRSSLRAYFPEILEYAGDLRIVSKVQIFATFFYRQQAAHLNNFFIIGDAYQSVSPATGMGISKCMTDIDVLLSLIRLWNQEGQGLLESKHFYENERKLAIDNQAMNDWLWSYGLSSSTETKWRFRRSKLGRFVRQLKHQLHA